MERKKLGFTTIDFETLSPTELDLIARTASTVLDRGMERTYNARLAAISSGDIDPERFHYVGLEWLEFLIRHCRLSPSGCVLDIGCGAGRIALPLSNYLGLGGAYYGFDVVPEAIALCRTAITRNDFVFQHFDLSHHLYNPRASIDSVAFMYPYRHNFFDAAFAASVFSHLDLATSLSYLKQIARVLKPGGRALLSFFAIPAEEIQPPGGVTSLLGAGDGEYSYRFVHRSDGYYTHCDEAGKPKNHHMPDEVGDPVAFEAAAFERLAKDAGLQCDEFLPGAWRFTGYKFGWQDMVVLRKPPQ